MNIYEEYANVRKAIESAQARQRELEEKIVEELKPLSVPMKTEAGTFQKVNRTIWKYSDRVTGFTYSETLQEKQKRLEEEEKAFKEAKKVEDDVLEHIKLQEQEQGIAEKEEKFSLRFTAAK